MSVVFFFFQAEDGIRDKLVTGVQTCALPISPAEADATRRARRCAAGDAAAAVGLACAAVKPDDVTHVRLRHLLGESRSCQRSEERRVGKECRCRWSSAR